MWRRLGWYARRLAVMERGELRHRVLEQMERRAARRERGGWARFNRAGMGPEPLPMFSPLFSGELPPAVERQLKAAARNFLSGHLRLLNRDWPEPILDASGRIERAVWTRDPVSRRPWPGAERFTFDVDFRFAEAMGDVKYVAELNRLHFLAAPAIYARRSGDTTLARALLGSLETWMEANPPGRGVNWYSGIEAGLRLASVAVVSTALQPWTDRRTGERLAAFVAAHGEWLARFPSLYSSANNHLVAEAMGLVLAARLLPSHPDAAHWLEAGRAHLEDRTLALFHEDGVGKEQSPAYSAFTLEMLALGFAAGGRKTIPGPVRGRLAAAAAVLCHFLDDAGRAPAIGDDDESRVLSFGSNSEPRHIASIAAAIAGLLGEPAVAPPVRDAHWRDLVFSSPDQGPVHEDGIVALPRGGYTIRRGAIAGRRTHLVFDHGPLGFGALAAHGHADALSLWLSLDGKPVLVDAGTHLYHSEGENRRRFRVTDVHNTLTIDGASQSEPSGAFNWMPRRAVTQLERAPGDTPLRVAAAHDGYAKRFGVIHHRAIEETATGFTISDSLTGTPPEGAVEIAFLLAPELDAEIDGRRVVARRGGKPEIVLVAPEGAEIQLIRAEADTGRGYHSPGFGILREAVTVIFRAPAEAMWWQSQIQCNALI